MTLSPFFKFKPVIPSIKIIKYNISFAISLIIQITTLFIILFYNYNNNSSPFFPLYWIHKIYNIIVKKFKKAKFEEYENQVKIIENKVKNVALNKNDNISLGMKKLEQDVKSIKGTQLQYEQPVNGKIKEINILVEKLDTISSEKNEELNKLLEKIEISLNSNAYNLELKNLEVYSDLVTDNPIWMNPIYVNLIKQTYTRYRYTYNDSWFNCLIL